MNDLINILTKQKMKSTTTTTSRKHQRNTITQLRRKYTLADETLQYHLTKKDDTYTVELTIPHDYRTQHVSTTYITTMNNLRNDWQISNTQKRKTYKTGPITKFELQTLISGHNKAIQKCAHIEETFKHTFLKSKHLLN